MLVLEEIIQVMDGVGSVLATAWKAVLHDDGSAWQFDDTVEGREAARIACSTLGQKRHTSIRAVKVECIYLRNQD